MKLSINFSKPHEDAKITDSLFLDKSKIRGEKRDRELYIHIAKALMQIDGTWLLCGEAYCISEYYLYHNSGQRTHLRCLL